MSITFTSIPSTNTNTTTNILHHLLLLFTFTTLILLSCIPTVSSRHLQILNSPAEEVTNDDAGNIQLKPIRLALYTTPTLSNETVDQVGEIIETIITNPMKELYENSIFDLDELDLVVLEFVSIYKVVYEEEDEGFGTRMRIPKANHDEYLRKRNLAETIYGTEIILGGNITFNGNTVPSTNRAFKETIQTMKSLTDQIQSAIQNSDIKDLQTVNFLKVARYKNLGPTAKPSSKPSLTPSALPNVVPSSQPTIIPSIVRSSVPTITASDQPSLLPSITPTSQPSTQPSTSKPTYTPSLTPSSPTMSPKPTLEPSISLNPSSKPSKTPTLPTLPTNIIAADDVDGSIENKGLDTGGSGMESWMLVTACAAAGLLVVGSGYYIRKRRNSDLNLGPYGNGIDVNDGGNEGNGNGTTTTTKTRGGFGFGIKKHKKNGSLTQVELKQLNEEERKKFHLQDVSDDDDDLVEIDIEGGNGKRYTGTPLPRCVPFFSSASPSKGSARSSSVGEDSPSSTAGTIMGFLGSSFTRVPSIDPSISSGTPLSRPRGLPRSITPQRNRSSGTGTGSETETSKEGISSSSSSPSPSPPGGATTYGMVHSPSNPWSASAAASNDRSKTPGTTTSTTTKNNNNILSTPDFPNTISLGGHHSSSTTKMGNKSNKIKTLKNNHNQTMTPSSSSARPISPSTLSPRSQKSNKSSGSTKSAASLEMAHSPRSSTSNKSGGRSKKVMTPPSTKRSMTLDLFGNEIPPTSARTNNNNNNNETTHEANAVDLEMMHNIMMGNARSPPAGGTSTGGSSKKIRSPPPSSSSKKNSKSTNGGGTIPPPPSSSSRILGIERVITTPPKTKKMVLNSSNTSSPMTSVKASKVSKEEFERADWDDEIPFHWNPSMEKELVGAVAAAGGRSSSKKKKSSLKPPTSPTKSTPKRKKVKDHYHSSENEDSSDGAFPRFQMSERDTTVTASAHRRRKSKGSITSIDASSSKSNSLQNSPHTNGESTAYHTVNQSYGSSNPDDVDVGGSSLNSSRSSSLHPLDWSNKGSMDTDQEVGRRMKGRGGGGNDGTSTLEDSSLSDNAVSPSARRRRQRHRRRLKVDLPSDSEDGDFLTPRSQFTMGTSGTRGDIGGGASHHLPTTPMTNASSVRSTYTNSTLGDASGASSKQLIKDLVWLEKKIADVKARVDRLDPEEEDFHANTTSNNSSPDTQGATTANNNNNNRSNNNNSQESMPSSSAPSTPSTPMSRDSTSTDGEGMIGSPISHNIVCRDCYAPPGKLHIVILSTKDGPEIKTVKPGSALEGKLFAGDLLVAVDDIDTRMMTSEAVMELMTARNTQERKLTVLHYE